MIHDLYYILNKLMLLIHVTTAIFEQNDTHYKPHHDLKKKYLEHFQLPFRYLCHIACNNFVIGIVFSIESTYCSLRFNSERSTGGDLMLWAGHLPVQVYCVPQLKW